jgi:hypothetical protein
MTEERETRILQDIDNSKRSLELFHKRKDQTMIEQTEKLLKKYQQELKEQSNLEGLKIRENGGNPMTEEKKIEYPMAEEKKLCKCGLATFGYADTTVRLKFFLDEARKTKDSRSFAAFVAQQLEDELYKMDEFCDLALFDAISKTKSIRSILKEDMEKPLDFRNFVVVESLLNELDPVVLSSLKKCAGTL